MKRREHQLDKLIETYLKNESSREERRLLDGFAESFRNKPEEVQMGAKSQLATDICREVVRQIQQNRQKRTLVKQLSRGISIAASLILIMGLSFLMLQPTSEPQRFCMETGATTDSLQLPDGSKLFLSPGTRVSYDKNFNLKNRQIELEKGNVFFKVARNPQKPFIITSGAIKTKVLGTSFNIHLGSDAYRVTVHSGKVNVFSDSESVDLLPLQESSYSIGNGHLSVRTVSRAAISPWYNSDITLTNQNLRTILDLIEQKFGLETIRLQQELLDLRATVFIARDATLESILQQINYITNLKLEAHGKEISCRI